MNDSTVATRRRQSSSNLASARAGGGEEDGAELLQHYRRVRSFSERIAGSLAAEDCVVQSMDDASPIKWHLAHTTWFFETFLLKAFDGYQAQNPEYEYLFNSYYNTVGEQYPRSKRGLISRPGMEETLRYRERVDDELLRRFDGQAIAAPLREVLLTGIQHEQQHQELMLTDLKHALSCNPTDPIYQERSEAEQRAAGALGWREFDPGIVSIGYQGCGFSYDNERPRHRVFLEPYQLASRCITNREYLDFIEDGGYRRPELWLSLGWSTVTEQRWRAPLYWRNDGGSWSQFTLAGRQPVDGDAPVTHVSYFEADAYARWAGCRLATEAEWEHAACQTLHDPYGVDHCGNWSDQLIDRGQPIAPRVESQPTEVKTSGLMGNTWQWTSSHYSAYPGYAPPEGALGEYNGKFMCNVFVLRGGACATPSKHVRASYRNFFAPDTRWQFSGIRLARS